MEQSVLERLLVEFNELNDRVSKCREFLLDESKSSEIDALNKDLLIAQLKVMESYLSILSIRIGLNAPKQDDNEESEQVND
jgi:hypothetical protein